MMKKNVLFLVLVNGCMFTGFVRAEVQKPDHKVKQQEETQHGTEKENMLAKVFDKGLDTEVNGNNIDDWLCFGIQSNPSPELEKTRVIEFRGSDVSGQKVFRDLGTLKSIRKFQNRKSLERFKNHAKVNNGTICPACIQVKNPDGEFKPVRVFVMGSQKNHCADAQKWIHEQEKEKDSQDQ